MRIQFFIYLCAALYNVAVVSESLVPDCVPTCWENSKYVSPCLDDITCLCDDTEYQITVLQCLYSQCHTAQFGSALHSTITRCSDYSSLVPDVLPPLIRHQGLRRRASSDNVQVSARPQASARPGVALASVTLSRSVQRRSVSASATASLIRSSRPTMLISPVQKFSGVTHARTALPTEFDDVGFNDIVAPNGTSSTVLHASGSFLSLAVHGRYLNGTGDRTTFDTRYTAMATIRAPGGGLGRNVTSDPSSFNQSRSLQSLRPTSPARASGTIYGSFNIYPNRTTGRLLLLPTGRPLGDSGSRSNISSSTNPVVALPSLVMLPPYHNATLKINGSGATNMLRSTHNSISFNYSVPTTINQIFRR